MDAGPDEREAARIRALLGEIEGQRARGELAFAAAPLRLYGVGGGRFVRVLDEHEEAISPRSARRSRSSALCASLLGEGESLLTCILGFLQIGAIAAFLDSRGSGGGARGYCESSRLDVLEMLTSMHVVGHSSG